MAENGAALQSYNNELVKCIEDLCSKRDDVSREIKMDEQEKEKLEHDIAILHERLQKVVTNLARKTQIRDEYGNFYQPPYHHFCFLVVLFQVPGSHFHRVRELHFRSTEASKVWCVFSVAIWPKFCMGQYRDDYRKDALNFSA